LELAIAVSLLKLYGFKIETDEALFLGELSLDGRIKKINGLFAMVLAAKELKVKNIFFPQENSQEVAMIKGIKLFPLKNLADLLNGQFRLLKVDDYQLTKAQSDNGFASIVGQEQAKRALVIAVTGRHNLIFIGSPGSGKSILAKSITTLLPPLSTLEATEVTKIYSIKGLATNGLLTQRPFREPHHSSSLVGILGGGKNLLPGEISLAHHGVLFLDEFLEYPRSVLESLRQPLETGKITITRSLGSVDYPARFMLVAAANPCPCGLWYQGNNLCRCSERDKLQYQQKLSGPILDRIDLQVKVKAISAKSFLATNSNLLDTLTLREKIKIARLKQLDRQGCENYLLSLVTIKKLANFSAKTWSLSTELADRFKLSNRGFLKVLRVARTVADLEASDQVLVEHLQEAFAYRLN
jgi:magnesium chelatase family protein